MKIMQNKCIKSSFEPRKAQRVPKVVKPVMKSRILFTHNSRYKENSKVSSSHNLVVPYMEGNEGTAPDILADGKLSGVHSIVMIQLFDKFLLQLDEIFMSMRVEEEQLKPYYALNKIKSYKDICHKLRLEILIAIDKLELTNIKGGIKEKDIEFLDKMNGLKSQLSEIRCQYHKAIQEWNLVDSK